MPVRDKVYEKMKSFGLTDSKEDFYKYYDNDENVRKDVFKRLQEDGLTDTEEEFYSYMQPSVSKDEDSNPFDANVERAKKGEPIQRVSTQSVIDANPELGLSDSSYEYKPEVQKYILDNKPDILKPKQSLMDAPLNTSAPEGSQEKFNERIGVAVKNLNDPTVQKGRTEAEFRGINASVDEELKSIEDQITSRTKAIRNENWRPGMTSTRDDSGLAELRAQRSYLEGAKELLEESEKIINASKDEKDGTFIGGVLRGTRDKVFDVDTWTMGLSDLVGGLRLKNVLEKVEKDEQLSSAEEKLLDAAVTNMAVNAYFASDLGKGYKAGQVTGESIPFMLEMAINPISASGNKLAKSLLKAGMKRFGSSINNNVAKATTRLATDALAATGMAATTGLPGVLGETVDRLNKNYNYGIDANGNLYAQKNGDVSFGEALGRSFTTRALENQSEMIFRAFDGAGELLKGVNVSLPGGVNTFFDYIKNSKVGELWRGIKNSPLRKELAEATKVGGIGEEYLEEVYNNFANVALGEMSMEEALNLDNNIDTFLGLAPTQVMFSMLGLGNMAALRYKTRRDIEDLRATMNESQRQALDGLLAMGTTATNQDVREFIRNTMANQSLSIDEKRNAVKAAYDVARQKAMADVQEAEVEDKIAEENADIDAKTDPQTGNYGEVTLLGVDESGEPTANPANVFGAKVVDGELYLLVLPEGETEKKWVRPHEYDAESHQIMPGAEVKAYNEQMIRDNAAKQAEQEAKYAPDVLNAQMQQGIPFEDATAVYIPFQIAPEGNAWQVEVYAKDEKGKPSKDATGVNVITNDQFRDILQAQYEANEAAQQPVQEVAQTVEAEEPKPIVEETEVQSETAQEGAVEVNPVAETAESVSNEEVQQPQQQAPVIPTKEDGSIDFVAYGKDNTFKTLGEKYGEKMPNKVAVTAKALAEDLVKAQEKLSKAEEAYDNAPIGREQKAEQARDKAKAELESIQREADFWSSLDNEIKEAQAKRDALLNAKMEEMGEEPMNADEFIAQQLSNGNITLDSGSYKKETGYGEKERQKFIRMFRKAENGGMTIERAGELLMQMDRENGTNFFNQNDANAGRDALINFLGNVSSWGDITGYIRNNREAQAAKETEGLRNEMEDAIEANYHMTPEEYATLQEMEAMENPFEGVDIVAKDAIFAEAAFEYEEYLKSLENGQGTTEEVIEGNSDVLSEEQSDNTGGTEQRQGEGLDVSEGTVQSDDAAQAEESAEVEEDNTPFRQTESVFEQAERIANEEARRKPLRERAKEWSKKLGAKVNLIESLKDVTNKDAFRAILNGERVTGWYEESTGEVCLYMPYLDSTQEVDETYIHEVVAHKGLRGLLGDKFNEFLDDVWDSMSEADKLIYITYPGVNGNKRAAADEYVAHLAENIDVTESAWGKLAELIKKFLKAIGLEPKMTHADIANTIKLSYQRLLSGEGGVDVVGDGTRFRTLEEINQTFNEEIQQQIDGTLPNGHIYQLGSPSAVLLSTGIADVPIELNSTRLEDKSKNFGHDYDLSELKDLVKAIHNPMAIFAYGDKSKAQNIIVEIQHEGKNFIVGLSIKPKVGGQILDINSIRNVFPKDNAEWLNWVSQGKLLYADKERIQDLINQQQTNLADVDYLDLDSIANIVKDFQNPTLPEEKTLFRTVYHGSGASFDKFDHSFMGTGEGNQSFGWGTYVTDVEGIGKQYASIYAKNSPLAANALRWIEENGTYEDFLAQGEGKRRNWAIRHAKDYLKELKKDGASEDVIKAYEQDLVDAENALSEEAYNRTKENMVASLNRNLYEVEIPDNDGTNYIAWDKMLPKDQAERIKDAVRNSDFFKDYEKEYGRLAEERLDSWTKTSGGRAYKLLGNFTHMDQGADKAISQLLSKAGFVGFDYPANYMSGGNDLGQKNYVIFDEKDLQIKEHTRFRVLNDKSGKKTLVGLHNISENKLRKAIKQGGLANPSVAVIDMDKQSHTDYGDITFVIPSSMIDKKTGKNVGTYLADAYTPVYPTVVKKMSDKGAKALTKALESVNEIFRSKVRTYFNSYLDSGTIYDALAYWYLSDTGKNPPILEAALPEGFTKEEVEKVKSINSEADSFFQLSEDEKQKALNLYADKFFGGMKEYENHLSDYTKRMQEVVKDESKPQMVRKNIQQNLNTIERYGYEYDRVAGYYNRAVFLADRQSKPSEIETFRNAFDEVSKNGLEEDFGNWLMAKEEEFGVEEKLFAGYDNQGRAKYLPNTLENASKLMKKEGRAGATGLGGFNYFVAILAPVAKTTKQISAKKGNLSTQEEYDKFVEEWKDYYHDLARQLQPGAGKWDDYGYHRLHEIAPMANPKAYVKKEYGIDLSDEFLKDLNDVKNAIKNDFPARYFETKFERPVYLNEVAAAVVPSDMSLDLYGQLQRMGIPMYEYERGNNEARMEAVDKVTIDNEGIRFRTLPSMKLRKLEEGEKCNVERVFTQQKMFNFSSGEKIESYEDVAYIFKSLEDEAIENTFVALIKDGKPTIVHLGMGTANQSTLDQQAVIVAIDRIKPDEVYMVHNHPSGNLKASRQDVVLLDSMKKAYGSIVKDGIIINLRSGRYSVFNEEGSYAESNPSTPSKEIPVKTYSFSKRVFDEDFDIQELINVRSADDANYYAEKHGLVAALTSSQRLGDRDKISLLVIDQSGKIVGNVFLNHTDVTPSNMTAISKDITYYTSAMSGQFAIIFGRMNIKEAGHLNMVVQRVSAGSVKMFDAISVNKDGGYVSAANEGVMEEAVDYANNYTRFRISNRNQEIFVSNAQKAVEGIKQEKATPQQWLAMIEKNGGLKAGEDKWLGLSDWLKDSDKKSITKAEILDFINQNKIVIEEVKYGGSREENYAKAKALNDFYGRLMGEYGLDYEKNMTEADRIEEKRLQEAKERGKINSTRLGYTTEGLENKAEIALTVPTIESWNENDEVHFGDAGEGRAVAWIRFGETTAPKADLENAAKEADDALTAYQNELAEKYLGDEGSGDPTEYLDMMSEDEGKHMRDLSGKMFDTRETANANQDRVLVIDEIQSKRHQEGRERGYRKDISKLNKDLEKAKTAYKKAEEAYKEYYDSLFTTYTIEQYFGLNDPEVRNRIDALAKDRDEKSAHIKSIEESLNKAKKYPWRGVPNAPFEKNWSELAFKRMLRYAAENGFDKVAWTTGAQQAERYNLSAIVDHIAYYENEDGTLDARAYFPQGGYQPIGKTWAEVESNVGKDIAQKMQEGVSENIEVLTWEMGKDGNDIKKEYNTLSGENLKLGGEGMKGFYDKMLPSFVNKYVKKWGTKVQDIELPHVEKAGRVMHSVDVTDAMKESVMEGQTMFRVNGRKMNKIRAGIEDFTLKYNSAPINVLSDNTTDEEVRKWVGLDDIYARDFINWMDDEKSSAVHSPLTGEIIIFADRIKPKKIEKTLFHENLHNILSGSEHDELVDKFYNTAKDDELFSKWRRLSDKYIESERKEEFFVYVVSNKMKDGNLEEVLAHLSSEEQTELFNILNGIGYGYEQERDRRASQTGGRGGRYSMRNPDVQEVVGGKDQGESENGRKRQGTKEQAERLKKLFDDVADMGLRGVLGNTNYDLAMLDIFYALPEKERTDVAVKAVKIGGDVAVAVDEYLNNVNEPTLWEKVVASIKNALRKVGIDVELTENDVKYLLWRSRKPLNRNSIFDVAEDIDMKRKLNVGKFDNDPTDGGDNPDGGGTRFRSSDNTLEQIKQARKEIERNPSESQKEAGNYKKGHIILDGFDITLENPKGGVRSGVDKNGKKWSITMNNDYGYIRGTEAVDGDHVDVFLSDNPTEGNVFVVDQSNEDGSFDESKVMYGFNSLDEARDAYLSNYEKGWDRRIMAITGVSKDEFKKWIDSSHKKTKAFSEYKNVNPEKNDIRFRVANKLQIRDEYEATIKKGGYQAREAVQDAMLSLRRTQELIEKASGKKLRGFENAWEHENRLSSVVQAEIHEMERKFYKPMMDAVKKLMDAMGEKNDYAVADYLMLKHGIERNREMAVRKALTDDNGKIDRTRLEQWYQDKEAIRNDANLPTWREKQEAMDNAALNYGADMSVDYSGLTSMFGSDDLADCTDKAYKEVEELEKKYPSETNALGKAVKSLNQSTIDKSFESGLMDRKVRDELKNDMYDYYVPLRGFDEVTSDEVYSYLDNDRNAFNAPLRRAKGRTSKADNPIAYMKSIAESGIMHSEKNKMKQSFLNMVTNHPSDLISVREGVWVVLNPATGEWEAASMPTIPNNATPADVESILEAWESSMEQQAATNPNIKKVSEGADVPYRVIGNRMEQHQVIIKRNGKSYTLTVNGNPRLAMALNGLTNPNNTSKDGRVAADVQKAVDKMNRTLAAWYTTRNPDFVASNFMRDTFYTNTIVRAKEGNKYANKFHKHYAELLMPGKMLSLFNKYENGKLDMSNKTEKAFYDFMMNGGETGYSNLKDIEHIKNEIAKQLKGDRLKWFRQISDKLDLVNRAVENTSRFAAFLTSREMGRDMSKSIFDAKEISVNFNKKGAGGTFYKGVGQTKFGNLAAMVGAGGRGLYVFFNAAIQGSTNLFHVMKVNPKGTSAGLAAMFLMGAVLPYLLSGDDDKDYYDLPDHVRRNHLVLPGPGDSWVSIPLPIEYRIMYGMGELFTSWRTGHERGTNIGLKALTLTGQALPLNFLEEGLDAFVPSALSPLWQAYNNRSWTGLPIYKDNEFNKDDPEYTKAYKNVDRQIYNFTKALYNWTFDEENQEEGIDLNPAIIESLARGYFGGLFTQMSNIAKTAETIGGEREFDWRNIPIGNRIFKSGDERTKEKRITNEYFDNMEKLDFLESRRRMLNRTIDGKAVPEEDVEKAKADLEQMIQTGVYQKYMKFKDYKKVVDKIRKAMKDNGSTEELERKLSEAQEKANEVLR